MKRLFLFIFLLSVSKVVGANEISMALGMTNVSFTENASASTTSTSSSATTTKATSSSGSMSIMVLDVCYNILEYPQKRFFVKAQTPFISSGITGLFMGGIGFDYFIKSYSTDFEILFGTGDIKILPTWRFFVGGFAGLDYFVYDTGLAEKSDVLFELSAHGGVQYRVYKKIHLLLEAGIGRGTGVATTTFNTRFLAGVSYRL